MHNILCFCRPSREPHLPNHIQERELHECVHDKPLPPHTSRNADLPTDSKSTEANQDAEISLTDNSPHDYEPLHFINSTFPARLPTGYERLDYMNPNFQARGEDPPAQDSSEKVRIAVRRF